MVRLGFLVALLVSISSAYAGETAYGPFTCPGLFGPETSPETRLLESYFRALDFFHAGLAPEEFEDILRRMIDRKEYYGFSGGFEQNPPVETFMKKVGAAGRGPDFEERIRERLGTLLAENAGGFARSRRGRPYGGEDESAGPDFRDRLGSF